MKLKQLNHGCRSHPPGKEGCIFHADEIVPAGVCPWLWYSLYPYFLGMSMKEPCRGDYNEYGDIQVGCAAEHGCNCVVKRRANDGSFGVGNNVKQVVFALVADAQDCPRHHYPETILFTNTRKDDFACAALWYQAFPFSRPEVPPCIRRERIRCSDWQKAIIGEIVE